jgi:hypothetical protein
MVEYPKSYEHPHHDGVTRPVGFFHEFFKAQKAVEDNNPGYYECRYDFVVIEKVEEGAWCHPTYEWWYQRNDINGKFEYCNKPSCYLGVSAFGIG